jgi:hypothetical protein
MATGSNYQIFDGTNYIDLSQVFAPLSSGIKRTTNTGFEIYSDIENGYQDLINLFASYEPGSETAPLTNYTMSNGQDLNIIFQKISPSYTVFGTYTISQDNLDNTIITFTQGDNNKIKFINNFDKTISYIVVGGGAGGMKGQDNMTTSEATRKA